MTNVGVGEWSCPTQVCPWNICFHERIDVVRYLYILIVYIRASNFYSCWFQVYDNVIKYTLLYIQYIN